MYKLILVLFLGVLYNSLSVEAQAFSPCPHTTAYVCDDVLDTDSVCLVIFNASNPNNGTIDSKCQNTTFNTAAAQCPYTCGACCQTPAYNCENAPSPNPFNCATLTRTQCLQTGAQTVLAQYCPATCGLCQVGNCTDVIDCTGLVGGCFDPATQAYMFANCAKTCGCPYGSGSIGTSTTCVDTNSNCATWNRNGFCASTYYTAAQKAQYCPGTCGLCSTSSGLSGVSGLSVSSGLSGVSGLSGSSGLSGLSGLSGSSGLSGISNPFGKK